jgi:alpha-galactosidase
MTPPRKAPSVSAIALGDDALELRVEVGSDGVARIAHLAAAPDNGVPGDRRGRAEPKTNRDRKESATRGQQTAGLPLVDVVASGSGRVFSARRYAQSVIGGRLRYVRHEEKLQSPWRELRIDLEDPSTGLAAEVVYSVLVGGGILRSRVRLTNGGHVPVTLESVTSFVASGIEGPTGELGEVDLLWAENDWLAENRWQVRALRDALPDLNRAAHEHDSRGRFGVTSAGSWSSGTYLPMGAAINRRTGNCWVWQIEHNGAWHWQVGEHATRAETSELSDAGSTHAYLALLGPTDAEHHWRLVLKPGESFETVPVAIALSNDGFQGAVARLTNYRRAMRRPHKDHQNLPVIFNDYLNTLMGNPTTDQLMPLIRAAAKVGAEYFCIDSGWYNEIGETWWDTVGVWQPSRTRFPNGLSEVLDCIRAEGMIPGLWLEPEVVGVRSPIADQLPAEAFFSRDGVRVVEQNRYHLDFSHPAAVRHLDEVVDFLVEDLGIGYLKMDYNINVGPGTDNGNVSAGVGMLAHNRAFLDWIDGILDRYPNLVLENCASGGMRTDYALLSRFQLQSTSDQSDFLRYPAIAAAAPTAVAPEQAGIWASPQPEWSNDEITFALSSTLLGRLHLSGHIDRMSDSQQQLVADAISAYKLIRPDLAAAIPFWPLGLPRWVDSWVALGMRAELATYVVVWHREPIEGASEPTERTDRDKIVLPVAHLRDKRLLAEVLYPSACDGELGWDEARGELVMTLGDVPSARLVRLTPVRSQCS